MLRRFILLLATALSPVVLSAAERTFDFASMPVGKPPVGFLSELTGTGAAGDWKVILADAPSAFQPLSPGALNTAKRGVLAQLAADPAEERFPVLVLQDEVFGDFTFTTKFKCVDGKVEQMAGVAFRYQDPKNYYIVRANALGNSFRFYKFVNGERSAPVGPVDITIPRGVWHEMTIECKGNQIRCLLNGKEAIPALTDNSFPFGKVGFWTKSDSVSQFADARITYTPRQTLAKTLVRDVLAKFGYIVGVSIYMPKTGGKGLAIVASNHEKTIGDQGGEVEQQVFDKDVIFSGPEKARSLYLITLPLHDRNGEVVAAVRLDLGAFPGQTEKNAILRAMPAVKLMEGRFKDARDLLE